MVKDLAQKIIHPSEMWTWAKNGFENGSDETESNDGKKVVKGYCLKKYEVSVGYDNITELFGNQEVITAICGGDKNSLPQPQILAVNCKCTDIQGDYTTQGACYQWDSNEALRKEIILTRMENDGILQKVTERGKESLKNFMSILCR